MILHPVVSVLWFIVLGSSRCQQCSRTHKFTTTRACFVHFRGLNQIDLPDQEYGVFLYDGHLSGLTNLHRQGDAKLEAETDHFILTFSIAAKNIKAGYGWKKKRLK